jgi:hypothetical protein
MNRAIAAVSLLTLAALPAGGCAGLSRGNLKQVAPVNAAAPRAGNVYLVRGFIGVFSTGIDTLCEELEKQGVTAHVFQDDQWSSLASTIRSHYAGATNAEPLVLVGHSYGADDVIRISRELNRDNITVDLLVTFDPVVPRTIPPNVRKCLNFYQSNGFWDNLPWLRGVPVKPEKPESGIEVTNANIRVDRTDLLEPGVDHFNIDKKPKIHGEVIAHVLAVCPARGQWRNHSPGSVVHASASAVEATPASAMIRARTAGAAAGAGTSSQVLNRPSQVASEARN